jgi:hypothetical protein
MSYRSISLIALTLTIACTPEQTDIVELPEQDTTNQGSGDTEWIPGNDTEIIPDNEPECSFEIETTGGTVEYSNSLDFHTSLGTPYGAVEADAEREISRFFLRASDEECGDLQIDTLTLYPSVSDNSDSNWYENLKEIILFDVTTGERLGSTDPGICFEQGCPQNLAWFGFDEERTEGWEGIYLPAGQQREIGVFTDLSSARDGETIQINWAPSATALTDIESGETYVMSHETQYGNELTIERLNEWEGTTVYFTTALGFEGFTSSGVGDTGVEFGGFVIVNSSGNDTVDVEDLEMRAYINDDETQEMYFHEGCKNETCASEIIESCELQTWPNIATVMGPIAVDEDGVLSFTDDWRVEPGAGDILRLLCDLREDAVLPTGYAGIAFDITTTDMYEVSSGYKYLGHTNGDSYPERVVMVTNE